MAEKVAVAELRIGMFVAELDRPWLGTPFLLQGFLIETQHDIDALRNYCQHVFVDYLRSAGDLQRSAAFQPAKRDAFKPAASAQPSLRIGGDTSVPPLPPPRPRNFHRVLRKLRQAEKSAPKAASHAERMAELRARPVPQIHDYDLQSDVEEELLYAEPFYDELRDSLSGVVEALNTDGKPDFAIVQDSLSEVVRSIQRNPDAAIWLSRLRTTDDYTYDHSLDVSVHLVVFGRFLGMAEETLQMLGLAGLMLDIGKSRIAPEMLTRSGQLEPAEFELIKAHVVDSMQIYRNARELDDRILPIIAQHHERHDGSGYPLGLADKAISLHGEMAGIVDTYCAMIRMRPYRAPLSTQRGLEYLVKARGKQYRDALVDQFVQCIGIYPVGSIVELNSGEVAVVVAQNQVRRLKPRVMILLAPDKTPDRKPRTLDLIYDPLALNGEPYRIVRALPADAFGIRPMDFFLE